MIKDKTIYVTQPLLPAVEDVNKHLKEIWSDKWLTNMGAKHNLLENRLKDILKVQGVSLFNNGTIALLTALKALDLPYGSEVITTPFTFAATPHCITWNGLVPVFCDVDPVTMCINADAIEKLINANTSAILGVHAYGFPCDMEKIDSIAKKYNLKVIYDAAHAFSTEVDGRGIGSFGDITMFSFHATKLFNTIEGGCLTYTDPKLADRIYKLRNFGIVSEEEVTDIGLNGKMNELQAAIGLLNLDIFREEQAKRAVIQSIYNQNIAGTKGIRIPQLSQNITDAHQYYLIVIEDDYPITRDELYARFKSINIMTRKYFYPICSDYECYKHMPSSCKSNLPIANDIKNRVLCLPFYGDLPMDICNKICEVIRDPY